MALILHSFYTGLERLSESNAMEFDGGMIGGDSRHTELLKWIALDMGDIRPPVVGGKTAASLDEPDRAQCLAVINERKAKGNREVPLSHPGHYDPSMLSLSESEV